MGSTDHWGGVMKRWNLERNIFFCNVWLLCKVWRVAIILFFKLPWAYSSESDEKSFPGRCKAFRKTHNLASVCCKYHMYCRDRSSYGCIDQRPIIAEENSEDNINSVLLGRSTLTFEYRLSHNNPNCLSNVSLISLHCAIEFLLGISFPVRSLTSNTENFCWLYDALFAVVT